QLLLAVPRRIRLRSRVRCGTQVPRNALVPGRTHLDESHSFLVGRACTPAATILLGIIWNRSRRVLISSCPAIGRIVTRRRLLREPMRLSSILRMPFRPRIRRRRALPWPHGFRRNTLCLFASTARRAPGFAKISPSAERRAWRGCFCPRRKELRIFDYLPSIPAPLRQFCP